MSCRVFWGEEKAAFSEIKKGSSPVGRPDIFLTSIAPLIPKYTINFKLLHAALLLF